MTRPIAEQIVAVERLRVLLFSRKKLREGINRKRSWRASEKAFAAAAYDAEINALQIAMDVMQANIDEAKT